LLRPRLAFWFLTAILFSIACGFVWGIVTVRYRLPPYSIIRRVAPISTRERRASQAKPSVVGLKPQRREHELTALPYIAGQIDHDRRSGVLLWDRDKAVPGANLYADEDSQVFRLLDMQGRLIHEWKAPQIDSQTAHRLDDGHLLVVAFDQGLTRIDRRSRVIWSLNERVHHHVQRLNDGGLVTLARVRRKIPEMHPSATLLADQILFLTPDGKVLRRIDLLEAVRRAPWSWLLRSIADQTFEEPGKRPPEIDVLHTNHVEVFDGSHASRSPIYRRGNILVSFPYINTIAIYDPEREEFVWVWGPGNLIGQHHPQVLSNGNILLFNNGASQSEVIELEPESRRVVWRYAPEGFFSDTRGSVQRLSNGNTLITESNRGHVIEVTPSKEIVWHFANPDIDEKGLRKAIYRMIRYEGGD
jgi:hypothetical protein